LFNHNNSVSSESEDLKQKLKLKEEECEKLFEEKKNIIDEIGSQTDGLNEYLKKEKDKLDIEVIELRKEVEELKTNLKKCHFELNEKSINL
jgi:hypothetical protein